MEIEVQLSTGTTITATEMKKVITRIAEENNALFQQKPLNPQSLPFPNSYYNIAIESIKVQGSGLPVSVYAYKLNYSKPTEDLVDNGDEVLSLTTQTILPSVSFQNLWDSIIISGQPNDKNPGTDVDVKNTLLGFMETALKFSDHNVCPDIVTCNRIVMLYGPPGTGKTTICRGLAHKLSIRLSERYTHGAMLEVNTHSLFSKWFAESGKMVKKLFDHIHKLANDPNAVVFVLIDEVESIATARQSSMNGSDPSDAIRVVNALLTQIDQLRNCTNVMIMATSNLTDCIDFAFLSRADIKQFIGPPCTQARYQIFADCINELVQKQTISPGSCIMEFDSVKIFCGDGVNSTSFGDAFSDSIELYKCAEESEGLSGRQLRRLPFLAFVYGNFNTPVTLSNFLISLHKAIAKELYETKKVSQ